MVGLLLKSGFGMLDMAAQLIVSSWGSMLGFAIFAYLHRRSLLLQLLLLIGLGSYATKLANRFLPLAKERVAMIYTRGRHMADSGVNALSATSRELASSGQEAMAASLDLLGEELNEVAKKGKKKLKKSKERLEAKLAKHFEYFAKKEREKKVKKWLLAPFSLGWWLLQSRPVQYFLAFFVLQYLLHWWKIRKRLIQANRGHGGDLSFGRQQLQGQNQEEQQENEPLQQPIPGGLASGQSAGLEFSLPEIVPGESGISDHNLLYLYGATLGLRQEQLPRFVMCVQRLEKGIKEGQVQKRELDLFIAEKGNLLLPGEFLVPGLESHDTLERRLRAMDRQERIRQRQLLQQEQSLSRHLGNSLARHQGAHQRRLQQLQDRQQLLANHLRNLENRNQPEGQWQAQQLLELELRQQRAQNRREQLALQRQNRRLQQERRREEVRRRAQENRLARQGGDHRGEHDPNGPGIDTSVVNHQGQGGGRQGGNEGNPRIGEGDEPMPDNQSNLFFDGLKLATEGLAKSGLKDVAEEGIEAVVNVSDPFLEELKQLYPHYFGKVTPWYEDPEAIQSMLRSLRQTPEEEAKAWFEGFSERFFSGSGSPLTSTAKGEGLKTVLKEGIKNETKRQTAKALITNTASKLGQGALIGAGVQYGFSVGGTIYRCYKGKNEKFNQSKGFVDSTKTLFSETYKDLPSVKEVALKSVGGTIGSMIGQVAIPIPVVGAVLGGMVGGWLGGKLNEKTN